MASHSKYFIVRNRVDISAQLEKAQIYMCTYFDKDSIKNALILYWA